jgi:hypothetical protein
VALAELHHLIERENRAPQAGAQFFSANRTRSTKCRCNSITAHHGDGPVRGRAERNAALVEVIKAYGDLAMTKREKGLNGRKVRMGRLVEAEMALICGKVITWFVGCRL